MAHLHVGTSGYDYPHWKHLLYEGIPRSHWLEHYARCFSTVELNNTFYQLPHVASVKRWRDSTPEDFLFACKGSRYLTHQKKLREPERGLERFFGRLRYFGPRLAAVLWQLPPQLKHVDLERLEHFLQRLPHGPRHALEFRGPEWYRDDVCALLDAYGVAFCEHDLVEASPPRPTGGFRYLRFHGTSAPYSGRYGLERLEPVADDLRRWRSGPHRDAFVYFNNDSHGHAVRDAFQLLELLGEAVPFELHAP